LAPLLTLLKLVYIEKLSFYISLSELFLLLEHLGFGFARFLFQLKNGFRFTFKQARQVLQPFIELVGFSIRSVLI
jgi:hypothetical protein